MAFKDKNYNWRNQYNKSLLAGELPYTQEDMNKADKKTRIKLLKQAEAFLAEKYHI